MVLSADWIKAWGQSLERIVLPDTQTDESRRAFLRQSGSALMSAGLPGSGNLAKVLTSAAQSASIEQLRELAALYVKVIDADNPYSSYDIHSAHYELTEAIHDGALKAQGRQVSYNPTDLPETGEELVARFRESYAKQNTIRSVEKRMGEIFRANEEESRVLLEKLADENMPDTIGDMFDLSDADWADRFDFVPPVQDISDYLANLRDDFIARNEHQVFVDIAKLTGEILPETPDALKVQLTVLKAAGGLKKQMPWDETEKAQWEAKAAQEAPSTQVDSKHVELARRMAAQLKALGGGHANSYRGL